MGDSASKHTGPIVLTDTHLEPERLENRPTTTERIVGDGKGSFCKTLKLLADSIVRRRNPLPSSK